ncbi:hypothetical protein AS594_38785 [Streptomyces agglomeratus]|uniref:Uncharacterized protein n=1 Tax=Streptomyces agglomeratus TaxID=285458 RepID=A0A1E5NYW5_9ACTN|nr:hypothetical protein AS594_38785 [Streptomyces agglomeratus]
MLLLSLYLVMVSFLPLLLVSAVRAFPDHLLMILLPCSAQRCFVEEELQPYCLTCVPDAFEVTPMHLADFLFLIV